MWFLSYIGEGHEDRDGAREANQQFSRLLGEVADGQEVVITRRGKPVASLVPYSGAPPMTPERKAAIERMIKRMRRGYNLGGVRVNRDEIYDRGLGDTTNPEPQD